MMAASKGQSLVLLFDGLNHGYASGEVPMRLFAAVLLFAINVPLPHFHYTSLRSIASGSTCRLGTGCSLMA